MVILNWIEDPFDVNTFHIRDLYLKENGKLAIESLKLFFDEPLENEECILITKISGRYIVDDMDQACHLKSIQYSRYYEHNNEIELAWGTVQQSITMKR